eukprot:2703709-Lingulodinium_polyedra.AAC.1
MASRVSKGTARSAPSPAVRSANDDLTLPKPGGSCRRSGRTPEGLRRPTSPLHDTPTQCGPAAHRRTTP